MNHHRESKEKNLPKEPPSIQQTINRSCLKNRSSIPSPQLDNDQTVRLSTYRVSFVHPNLPDGKVHFQSQSQLDLGEKKRRSDLFMKKAKELQLAEITYFKDHARDKEPIDE